MLHFDSSTTENLGADENGEQGDYSILPLHITGISIEISQRLVEKEMLLSNLRHSPPAKGPRHSGDHLAMGLLGFVRRHPNEVISHRTIILIRPANAEKETTKILAPIFTV